MADADAGKTAPTPGLSAYRSMPDMLADGCTNGARTLRHFMRHSWRKQGIVRKSGGIQTRTAFERAHPDHSVGRLCEEIRAPFLPHRKVDAITSHRKNRHYRDCLRSLHNNLARPKLPPPRTAGGPPRGLEGGKLYHPRTQPRGRVGGGAPADNERELVRALEESVKNILGRTLSTDSDPSDRDPGAARRLDPS